MTLDQTLLLTAFRHRILEPDITAGMQRFQEIVGHPIDEDAFRAAVARAIASGHIHDPVRLPPGALQCHWHLELTPTGVAAARALLHQKTPEAELRRLLDIMAALRDPASGCPWDREQTFETIAPYTIEEAYEVADAIARRDFAHLPDELGDLLFQVVYHARMAEEAGRFSFADVARTIADKMVRRHPHVFGDAAARDAAAQTAAWEAQKSVERAARAETGVLAGVPLALPALTRAQKLTARAARVGFDWPDAAAVLDKLEEETAELRAELADADPARLADEVGDLLFVLANLARKLKLDPEECLRQANAKFMRRFTAVEHRLADAGKTPADSTLEEMEAAWQVVKRTERG
jgi:ATP diphosphatase